MMLSKKVAIIYGASGAVGSAVARAFAREGASVFVTGRRQAPLEALAQEILRGGGAAHPEVVDALDENAVAAHLREVVARAGRVDISFNALGIPQTGIQGTPLTALTLESFTRPLDTYLRAHFITARAAGRQMTEQRGGVILMHTPEPARLGVPLVGGMGPMWAALEALARFLSTELAPFGVRAVCLRSTGLPETATIDEVFGIHAKVLGIDVEQFRSLVESRTHRRRSTSLAELADAAVFAASDRGAALTGTTLNLTGGLAVD